MSKRGVTFLLVLTAVIALGALAQDIRFDSVVSANRAAGAAFDWQVRDLEHAIDALDGAERAAIASGQTAAEWLDRESRPITEAETQLANLRAAATDPQIAAALDNAAESFARFRKGDSTNATQAFHDALAKARSQSRSRMEAAITQLVRLRFGLNAIALLFTLAVAIYLGRVATVLGVKHPPSTAQMLRDLPPPVKSGPPSITGGPSQPAAATAAASAGTAAAPAPSHRPGANLAAAAELCVDLAKVLDAEDLPVLLERAAALLEARGIVLWAVDSDGARLRPSLSHGYPEKVLARLRPLQIDADNVTSLAFRSLQPQMMNGSSPSETAALAVPLLTGSGCVGVMAVELRHNRPHADLLPVARILGAQFSTLIAPPETAPQRTAHA